MISIFILLAVVVFLTFFIDADLVTSACHLFRVRYRKQCLRNKTIWIVGASSGVGECLVYECAANGAKCILISSRRQEQLQRVASSVNTRYPNTQIIVVPFDITTFTAESGFEECRTFIMNVIEEHKLSDIDILVMNTGITARALCMETSLTVMKRLMDVNVYGIIAFTQSYIQCLRDLKWIKASNTNQARGVYVTSSLAGLVGSPGQGAYALSKHAINGYMRSLRYETSIKDNVHIGLVCPGPFRPTEHSHDGLGSRLNENSGRLLAKDMKGKKMTSQRAAELYVTCMAFRITEAW
eukprot:CAMPEP_0202695518 /NCGR_PEP_ID=MMETSP1385-20130828/9101_1 /ASSEMBLY_ACC=CAM_ASM_000861 /TAXON_ID=933848 /ORGANISM="Elphidium margaritaceum" /LENGTH=296 /DNA_ID=CAMNT_0049351561 /DNA_START=40 /DNA_END=927 /DNA_ORIENTATION=-